MLRNTEIHVRIPSDSNWKISEAWKFSFSLSLTMAHKVMHFGGHDSDLGRVKLVRQIQLQPSSFYIDTRPCWLATDANVCAYNTCRDLSRRMEVRILCEVRDA